MEVVKGVGGGARGAQHALILTPVIAALKHKGNKHKSSVKLIGDFGSVDAYWKVLFHLCRALPRYLSCLFH